MSVKSSHKTRWLLIGILIVFLTCGYLYWPATHAAAPAGHSTPVGWSLVDVKYNSYQFEGTVFYMRLDSPTPPQQAAKEIADDLLGGPAVGSFVDGPTKITEADIDPKSFDDFTNRHRLSSKRHQAGWKVSLECEPSYYLILAFPRGSGSVVEVIHYTAL